ncbi:MAG TPA: four helix bundle protein [Flavipsychrobacter sp.]|nr:four helix bundle protein [Flavipsychrobacter sp.]
MFETNSLIAKKSFDFALKAISIYRDLQESKEFILSKQFLRAATSIGANVSEATAAQSRKDFIAKMAIASKEARETDYWLRLLMASSTSLMTTKFTQSLLKY